MKTANKQPLISVIVPIYKVEKYLSECVESLLAQSYKNLEIILVDDGSPDDCPALCDEYAKKDKRIKVVHKKNGGLSDARNAGIEIATGEYICFVDSDDYVAKDYIKKLYDALYNNGADMAVCGYEYVLDDGSKETDEKPKAELLTEDEYWSKVYDGMFTTFVVAWNKLCKADIFKTIRYTKGKINEDQIILHDILRQCQKIAVIEDSLYFYRKREDSIMGKEREKKILSDDAFEGLLGRAEYFLDAEKYELCATQIYALLGEVVSGKQARKFSKRMAKIVKNIPKQYKPKDLDLKISVLRFAPHAYSLKKLR